LEGELELEFVVVVSGIFEWGRKKKRKRVVNEMVRVE